MELISYLCALALYFNIFGTAVLFLDFTITEIWYSVLRFSKRKKR